MSTTPTSTTTATVSLPQIAERRALTSRAPAVPDLASLRLRKGISLEDISSRTKIAVRYLQAIEQLDFAPLPGGVYNISYIRQYARSLDIDDWDLVAVHGAWQSTQEPKVEAPPPPAGWSRVLVAIRSFARFMRGDAQI